MRFSSRLFGATPVGSWLAGRGAGVKSIQRGTIAIAAGTLSNTATITGVDTNNAVLYFGGQSDTGTSAVNCTDWDCRIELTNSTTITAVRQTNAEADAVITVAYTVVERNSGVIRSIQRGTITNTGTATITAVDLNKSVAMYMGHQSNSVAAFAAYVNAKPNVVLTNATTATATSAGGNFKVGYQVVEYA